MKKNLLYLFALICSVSLFTACSDDDEKTDDSWKAVSATYSAETLKLSLDGTEVSDQSVKVIANSAEAKLKLQWMLKCLKQEKTMR